MTRCYVTLAPGSHYVCWTHREFLPWWEPFNDGPGCSCEPKRTTS